MKLKYLFASLGVVSLMSCSALNGQDGLPKIADILAEQTDQNGRTCVRVSDIDGYGYRNNIVTVDGGRDYYLVTTVMRCHAMDMAMAASFQGPHNEICGGGSSRIVSADGRCTISKIFEFDDRASAFAALDKAQATLDEAKMTAE